WDIPATTTRMQSDHPAKCRVGSRPFRGGLVVWPGSFCQGDQMKITIVAAALFAVAATGAARADTALSKSDMQALFPGTFAGEFEGYKLVIHADSNGSLRGKAAGHYYDEGRSEERRGGKAGRA